MKLICFVLYYAATYIFFLEAFALWRSWLVAEKTQCPAKVWIHSLTREVATPQKTLNLNTRNCRAVNKISQKVDSMCLNAHFAFCPDRILSVKAAVGTSRCLLWMLNIVKIIPNFVDTFSINLSPEHYCNTLYWRRWLWRGRAMAHWRGWAGRGTRATTSTRGQTPWPPSTSATRRTCTASSSKTRKPTKSCRWPPDWRECWMCGNQTTMELSKQEKPYKSKRKNSCCDWKRSLVEIFKYYNRKLADRIPIPKNVWCMVFAERLYFRCRIP